MKNDDITRHAQRLATTIRSVAALVEKMSAALDKRREEVLWGEVQQALDDLPPLRRERARALQVASDLERLAEGLRRDAGTMSMYPPLERELRIEPATALGGQQGGERP